MGGTEAYNEFPTLYAKASTGRIKVWKITSDKDNMLIESGLQGGTMKKLPPKKIVGKNIGKANETTPEMQCYMECKAKWQKKIDEQYVESEAAVTDYTEKAVLLPMLAHKFTERKHNIKYPCYLQPKLNGVRCIHQGLFTSRKGKQKDVWQKCLAHVKPELDKLGIDKPDGEVYIHGYTFQEIVRLLKKYRPGESEKLEYWVYDQVNEDSYKNRLQGLINAFPEPEMTHIKGVKTVEATCEEDIKVWHDTWVKQGFEGIIIRNADGLYKVKHRSADLQKYKEFIDAEFKIVGGHEGTGTDAGTVVFEVETPEGKRFSVRPKGSRALRAEYLAKLDSLIGEELTVRYQNLSDDNIPIFPVGICIRDYE